MEKKKEPKAAVVEAAPVSAPVPAKPAIALTEFVMPSDNTCTKCGAEIKQGEPVFAASMNQVVAGQGICKKCAE